MTTPLGRRLKAARTRSKLLQAELAAQLGVSREAYNKIETGAVRDPRFSLVVRCAQVLGVSVDHLAGFTSEKE
jgi:transcriptional regulator with XRE-family HTH domain